jgi:hypothetical protein
MTTSLADRALVNGHAALCPRHGLIHGTATPADFMAGCNWQRSAPVIEPSPATVAYDSAGKITRKVTLRGVLITSAAFLLAALAAAEGIVSWHGQYSFLIAIKHQELSAALEALGPDCGAVIFALLGVALALLGRRAITERILVCACSGLSIVMNLGAANLGSPRAIGAYVMPPVLFAITSDRLIATVRLAAIGKDETRSAWTLIARVPLWALRLAVAPGSTVKGARSALLAATPLPEPEQPAPPPVVTWMPLTDLPRPAPELTIVPPASRPALPPRPVSAQQPKAITTGPTKAEQLIEKASKSHDLAAIDPAKVSALATSLAAEAGMHPASARRTLIQHVRKIQGIQP